MNKRRELALQRLSRIDTMNNGAQNRGARFKGSPAGAMSIEAAIGAYMNGKPESFELRYRQDAYTKTPNSPKHQMSQQMTRQMAEYMAVAEESQLANARTDLSDRAMDSDTLEEILAADPSAQYQFRMYGKKAEPEAPTVYDRLDADRCAGFLLYSYNKNGAHSVLGEHISPGSYGGRITSGEFLSKA